MTELHYICHIDNLPSIFANGILSHRRAQRHNPVSIADQDVQARRSERSVMRGKPLHSYVNLYLNARNPMMFRVMKADQSSDHVCVLSVSKRVLELDDAVLADGNAAAEATAFHSALEGLARIKRERVFARYWTHPGDPIEEAAHKREMCAEILVPGSVDAGMILGVYIASDAAAESSAAKVANIRAIPRKGLFFR